jgi:hypothetical protein
LHQTGAVAIKRPVFGAFITNRQRTEINNPLFYRVIYLLAQSLLVARWTRHLQKTKVRATFGD